MRAYRLQDRPRWPRLELTPLQFVFQRDQGEFMSGDETLGIGTSKEGEKDIAGFKITATAPTANTLWTQRATGLP